jgi:hypothetical protein
LYASLAREWKRLAATTRSGKDTEVFQKCLGQLYPLTCLATREMEASALPH